MTDVGIIGLGVMGSCLAENLADHGYNVHAFNRTQSKTDDLARDNSRIRGYTSIEDLTKVLPKPRVVIMMLPAGQVVDEMLRVLDEFLDGEDVVVDAGNSDYKDTIRRNGEHDYALAGCGISGGQEGARHGPSIMVGCPERAYKIIGPILEEISAKVKEPSGNYADCCAWLGEDGAGHFVKAVHNGIEYCEMALLQEAYNMLYDDMRTEDIQGIFEEWNREDLKGYLVEICAKILKKTNKAGHVIDQIEDRAEQKGTGKMCIVASIEANEDTTLMAEAVMSRFLSNRKEKRLSCSRMLESRDKAEQTAYTIENLVEDIRDAFYLCKIVSYVQGFNLINAKGKEHGWDFNQGTICDIWRNGCILRSDILSKVKHIVEEKDEYIEDSPEFLRICRTGRGALKRTCTHAITRNIYAPVFTSCLMWINGLGMAENNGTLIQAMRDYFGRHGVVLKNGSATSIDWGE